MLPLVCPDADPAYLEHVDRWWHAMLPRIRPRMRSNGGPVLMVQIENEYGSCGADKAYLGHLAGLAKHLLGEEALLYTTDSRGHAQAGSLPGAAVLSAVDFGPGWFYPGLQRAQFIPPSSSISNHNLPPAS